MAAWLVCRRGSSTGERRRRATNGNARLLRVASRVAVSRCHLLVRTLPTCRPLRVFSRVCESCDNANTVNTYKRKGVGWNDMNSEVVASMSSFCVRNFVL